MSRTTKVKPETAKSKAKTTTPKTSKSTAKTTKSKSPKSTTASKTTKSRRTYTKRSITGVTPSGYQPRKRGRRRPTTQKSFDAKDDFAKIITTSLGKEIISEINPINTGWTNFVFEVTTDANTYIFRFPRDDFWSNTLIKDFDFCRFISDKTKFRTVQPSLHFDHSRPFMSSPKIPGTALAERFDQLTSTEIETISKEIAEFLTALHTLDFDPYGIFQPNPISPFITNFIDELLDTHIKKKVYRDFWDYDYAIKKPHARLVHGDFNPSNIILDDDNHVIGIIDFGFAGFGNPYHDLSRIIGRCPAEFRKPILSAYTKLTNMTISTPALNHAISTWANIDQSYIDYMNGN